MMVSDKERAVMKPIIEEAKKGDTAALKSLENWYSERLAKPIPETSEDAAAFRRCKGSRS